MMAPSDKTREEMAEEINVLKQRIAAFEMSDSECRKEEQIKAYRDMGGELLQILNEEEPLQGCIRRVLAAVKARTGLDAVGIRLQNGEDFPYFVQAGFSEDFLLTENTLIARGADGGACRDCNGNVRLECSCGLVISGKDDPLNPFLTRGGSYWTNDSFALLELPSGQDPRLNPRHKCTYLGYASVALVPIRIKDRIVGLLQLNDRRKGCFSLAVIEQLESIAAHFGKALMRKRAAEALHESEASLREAQKIARMGRWEIDLGSGRFRSDGIHALFGVTPEAFAAAYGTFPEFVHPDDRVLVDRAYRASVDSRKPYEVEHRLLMADGSIKWVNEIGRTEYDTAGRPVRSVGTIQDITERKSLESKLLKMVNYDALTALPNRKLLLETVNMGIAHARRTGKQCAILFVDLDHFKNVNDTLGHSLGDELLKDTAVKLSACIRETDIMARLGGDEFIIFLNDLESGQGAQYTAERIMEQFNAPRMIAGNDLFVTASVGIAVYPHDGDSIEDLLKNADTAMYVAKQFGRNMFRFFDSAMNKNAVSKMQVERGLRTALEKKEFVLFYQPVVTVADGGIRGFEALLRWSRTEGGLVFPDEFIPVAEETGLIVPVGAWALHEACRFNKHLFDSGHTGLVMSVNVSVVQLRHKNLVDIIQSALLHSGLLPGLLEIEVTESVFIEYLDAAVEVLKAIRALGVQVSLDDFGTGYSSLVHLQKMPIGILKIDRVFIREIARDSDERAMIPAIIDLAHKLKLEVVAEGVETGIQLEQLSDNRCDYYQGWFFSKPLPPDQVAPFLARAREPGQLRQGFPAQGKKIGNKT